MNLRKLLLIFLGLISFGFAQETKHRFRERYNAIYNLERTLANYKASVTFEKAFQEGKLINLFEEPSSQIDQQILDSILNKGYSLLESNPNTFHRSLIFRVIAQTYYYKRRYFDCISIAEHVLSFSTTKDYSEMYFWLARSYQQLGLHIHFKSSCDSIEKYIDVTKFPLSKLTALKTNQLILEKNDSLALAYTKKLLHQRPNKNLITRSHFLLGQLYQIQGDIKASSISFKKVLKADIPDELYFSAQYEIVKNDFLAKGVTQQSLRKVERYYEKASVWKDRYLYVKLIGEYFLNKGEYFIAEKYFNKAYQDINGDYNVANISVLNSLIAINEQKEDLEQKAVLLEELNNVHDNWVLQASETESNTNLGDLVTNDFSYESKLRSRDYFSFISNKMHHMENNKMEVYAKNPIHSIENESVKGINDLNEKELELSLKLNWKDTADYLFIINVKDISVNLTSSRYGIGQLNRGDFSDLKLTHKVHDVNSDYQWIVIGVFKSLAEVKKYESRIVSLLKEIMKVGFEKYFTFVIPLDMASNLRDKEAIEEYYNWYINK